MHNLNGIISSLGQNNLWQKLLTGGLAATGEVGNVLEGEKRSAYQNFVMSLLKNPGKLAQMAAQITQPLSRGLEQSVGNQVQGDLASRGLSQAPGIFAATESQALAPYEQQNQNIAMQAVLQSLGLPAGTFAQPTNLGPSLGLFLNQFKTPPQPNTNPSNTGLTLPTAPPISDPNDPNSGNIPSPYGP
jgi:hypothetical protein